MNRFDAVIHNAGFLTGPDVLTVNRLAPSILTARMAAPNRLVYPEQLHAPSGSADLRAGHETQVWLATSHTSSPAQAAATGITGAYGGPDPATRDTTSRPNSSPTSKHGDAT
ncbi:hypothetical protein ILP97_05145 [Amycolatopsis sp. H6(2020)]|nr:hypothetical protein [Amycolatopsis sp. H6(2020)]